MTYPQLLAAIDVLLLARLRGVTRCWYCGAMLAYRRATRRVVGTEIVVRSDDGKKGIALVCPSGVPCQLRVSEACYLSAGASAHNAEVSTRNNLMANCSSQ